MKIVVLSGSPRKIDSYKIIKKIESQMINDYNATFEYIDISSSLVEECKGCMQCFQKGEQFCPLKDDVEMIRNKLKSADGIIFASPVYAMGITGTMKKLVDRMSYMFHRPELIAKPAITVVTTGGGGQKPTQKYLKLTATGWGCTFVNCISIVSPFYFENSGFYMESYEMNINKKLVNISKQLGNTINTSKLPKPSFFDIYMFNGLKSKSYTSKADRDFWNEKNWLDSDYYYNTKIGPLKLLFGKILNGIIKAIAQKYYTTN